MLVLTCNNIEKSYGIETVIEDISFNVADGDKIGLIGHNGSGKTTLFKIISKNLDPDHGDIYIRKDLRLGYLEQHTKVESDKTLFEECLTVFEHLIQMEKNLRQLEEDISTAATNKDSKLDSLMDSYSKMSEDFSKLNGYGYESSIRGTLIGLGFTEEDFDKPVDVLSGGQKSRLALSKMLLEKPDILLLDEPTNHLDIEAIDWLAKFIKEYDGATLLISHDRYFLDESVNRIFHLENLRLKEYNTNYTDFVKRRKKDIEINKKHFENQQEEIARHKKVIQQYISYGGERYNRLAKSRQKMLDKIEVMDQHSERDSIRFKFKPKIESGTDVLQVENLAKSFGDVDIFKDINFNIYKGERVGLIGPNGVGKSTLFKIILEKIQDYKGKAILGHHVQTGYFDQEMSDLSMDKTIIDEIWDDNPTLTHTEIRTILSQFMFIGDDVFKEISDLSGGEKGRLSILKLILSKSNFLLMDEPTNHLDIDSKEILEEAILDYEGTLFVISHDRYFLNRIVDKIFLMTEDGIEEFLGNYDYYVEKINEEKLDLNQGPEKTRTQIQNEKRKERDRLNEQRELKKEIKNLEEDIEELEKKIQIIDLELSETETYEDQDKVMQLSQNRDKIDTKLNKLYEKLILLSED